MILRAKLYSLMLIFAMLWLVSCQTSHSNLLTFREQGYNLAIDPAHLSYYISLSNGSIVNGVNFTFTGFDGSVSNISNNYSTTVNGNTIKMVVGDSTGNKFAVDFTLSAYQFTVSISAIDPQNIKWAGGCYGIGQKERILGLGENFDSIDNYGKVRRMYLEILPSSETGTNEVHVPVPFLISTKGYALFVNNKDQGIFDVGATNPDLLCLNLITSSLELHYFFKNQNDLPVRFIEDYVATTGYPPLPPVWAFGGMFWRDEYPLSTGDQDILDDAYQLRTRHIPVSVLWIDAPWETGENTFDYDLNRFSQPTQTISQLQSEGFYVINWATEHINEPVQSQEPATAPYFNQAETDGYFVTAATGGALLLPWGRGLAGIIDFTNPHANAWYQTLIKKPLEMGGRGFKLDYGEDVVPSLAGTPIDIYRFYNNGRAYNMHAEYKLLYHKDFYEAATAFYPKAANGADNFFIIARTGTIGSQSYVDAIWPGDLDNNFSSNTMYFTQPAADGTLPGYVGGLKSAIFGGINLGIVGFPFYGSDIGGYRGGTPTEEVMARWIEFGAFSPIMQYGGAGDRRPWVVYDQQLLSIYETYTTLHALLFPYIYSNAYQSHNTGAPIMMPLYLQFPNDSMVFNYPFEYMFGSSMLVSPVVTQGATTISVYLPSGSWWYPFNGGKAITGGTGITVATPLETIPVFVRAGSIIPMLTYAPDTFITGTTVTVTTLANVITAQTLRVYPGANGSFTVYDGSTFTLVSSGAGLNPQQGISLTGQNGQPLQPCGMIDNGAIACGIITGADFSVNGNINGVNLFTLYAKPSNPDTVYRIEVF
ncbi:MAG: TIM-barrel domain-containing protein [bacterium]